ncbi:MAG: hypothetical protein U0T11_07490 [Chitinophagaceae bacterium]
MSVLLLLCLYTVAYTPVHELFKLPALVAHFAEHRTEDAGISLLSFLRLHYLNGNQKDADYDRDMQLPFKTGECTLASFAAVFIPVGEKSVPDVPVAAFYKAAPGYKERNFSTHYLASIWQPPRVS